jgi:hypothetical protein
MRHYCTVFIDVEPGQDEIVRKTLTSYPGVTVSPGGACVRSENLDQGRKLYAELSAQGLKAGFQVQTEYDRKDASGAELGIVELGPASSTAFRACLEGDAFDNSIGCPECGLGGARKKPQILSPKYDRSRSNFEWGQEGTFTIFVRAEIGLAIAKATAQPGCVLAPIERSGKVVDTWLELVPTALMPPLSAKSEGLLRGATLAMSSLGEPARAVDPCTGCGRATWAEAYYEPTRLLYSRAAVKEAQKAGISLMYEPKDVFPRYSSRTRKFESYYGFPWLVLSKAAIEVLLKYMQTEHTRDSAFIRPIYSE